MTKFLLGGAILALTVTSQAQVVKTETRTEYTGKDQVISVGSRCTSAREDGYFNQLVSDFSMTRCRQKKTFQVEVESTGKWYKWSKKVTAIPGTESYVYEMITETKSSTRTFGEEGYTIWDRINLENQCNELRRAYAGQVINMGDSNCGAPTEGDLE